MSKNTCLFKKYRESRLIKIGYNHVEVSCGGKVNPKLNIRGESLNAHELWMNSGFQVLVECLAHLDKGDVDVTMSIVALHHIIGTNFADIQWMHGCAWWVHMCQDPGSPCEEYLQHNHLILERKQEMGMGASALATQPCWSWLAQPWLEILMGSINRTPSQAWSRFGVPNRRWLPTLLAPHSSSSG